MRSAERARGRAWRGPVTLPLPEPRSRSAGRPCSGVRWAPHPEGQHRSSPACPAPHTARPSPGRGRRIPSASRPGQHRPPPGPRGPHTPRRARPWWPWPQGGREGERRPLSALSPPPPGRCRPLCPPPRRQQRQPRRRLRPPEMGLRPAVTARPRLLPGRHRHRRRHRHHRRRRYHRHGPAGAVGPQARPRGRRCRALLQVATVPRPQGARTRRAGQVQGSGWVLWEVRVI